MAVTMFRRISVIATVALVVTAAACGGKGKVAPPKRVPVNLVPATIGGTPQAPDFTLSEFTEARKDFAKAGDRTEVADGRLWEIRRGATLVGTLQISTVKPNIDLTHKKQRDKIIDLVMQGSATTIKVRDVQISTSTDAQKTEYLWFGKQMFEYLQIKGTDVKPETILRRLLVVQKPTGELDIRSRSGN